MRKIILPGVAIAFIYVALVIYLTNISLVESTIFGNYPLTYKVGLMINLLSGLGATMSGVEVAIILAVAILTGLNLSLSYRRLRHQGRGKSHLTLFGGAVLGIVGSGCGSCGLPLVSIVGTAGSLAFLPFKGIEISLLALGLLILSLIFLMKKPSTNYCKIRT